MLRLRLIPCSGYLHSVHKHSELGCAAPEGMPAREIESAFRRQGSVPC